MTYSLYGEILYEHSTKGWKIQELDCKGPKPLIPS